MSIYADIDNLGIHIYKGNKDEAWRIARDLVEKDYEEDLQIYKDNAARHNNEQFMAVGRVMTILLDRVLSEK